MGAMPIAELRPAIEVAFAPGDWLVLLSDGIYEFADAHGSMFGKAAVEEVLRQTHGGNAAAAAAALLDAVRAHAGDAPQQDDITMVLLKRI